MTRIFIPIYLVIIIITGCATSGTTFYWGEYSSTLYDLKKNPDEKTLEAHKKQLLLIIEESVKRNKKIPPGVNAEYGYMLLQSGKETEGMEFLEKETAIYPESVVFVQRLKMEYARRKQ